MSQENLELVRAGIRAMESGDLDQIVAGADPQVEFVNPPYALEPGTRTGPEGLRAGLAGMLDAFEELRVDVDRYIDLDQRVVALGSFSGRGRGSGAQFSPQPFGLVFSFRDGRLVRYEWYWKPSDALEAVGVPEQDAHADTAAD
jgi:ketosteroid isomerase-like protein